MLLQRICRRWIVSLPVENIFNIVKSKASKTNNKQGCAPTAWANAIDRGILAERHKVSEISHHDAPHERRAELPPAIFTPPLRQKHLHENTKKARLHEVVSTGPPLWYSPGASNMMQPECDLVLTREAIKRYTVGHLEHAFLCRLVNDRICLKRVADDVFYFGCRDICASVGLGWPATADPSGVYVPSVADDAALKHLPILHLAEWHAFPFEPISPQHKAIIIERNTVLSSSTSVLLKDSSSYGRLHIAARPTAPVRSLGETMVRMGFGTLPLTYLRLLVNYLAIETPVHSMLEALTVLATFFVADLTDDDMDGILLQREVAYEPDEDLTCVLGMEDVAQNMSADDRKDILNSIDAAKKTIEEYEAFKDLRNKWKACRDRSRVCSPCLS